MHSEYIEEFIPCVLNCIQIYLSNVSVHLHIYLPVCSFFKDSRTTQGKGERGEKREEANLGETLDDTKQGEGYAWVCRMLMRDACIIEFKPDRLSYDFAQIKIDYLGA